MGLAPPLDLFELGRLALGDLDLGLAGLGRPPRRPGLPWRAVLVELKIRRGGVGIKKTCVCVFERGEDDGRRDEHGPEAVRRTKYINKKKGGGGVGGDRHGERARVEASDLRIVHRGPSMLPRTAVHAGEARWRRARRRTPCRQGPPPSLPLQTVLAAATPLHAIWNPASAGPPAAATSGPVGGLADNCDRIGARVATLRWKAPHGPPVQALRRWLLLAWLLASDGQFIQI